MATLPLDLTGQATTNKISNEVWTVGPGSMAIVPQETPFFTKGLVVQNAAGQILAPVQQYMALDLNQAATAQSGQDVCGAILITDPTQVGQITITYQAIGGQYSGSNSTIAAALATLPLVAGQVQWGQIVNPPATYAPTDHTQDASTIYGLDEVVYGIEGIRQAVLLGDQNAVQMVIAYVNQQLGVVPITQAQYTQLNQSISNVLTNHLTAIYPSALAHTPTAVGLGNVANWLPGTQADHQAGTSSRYATCSGVLTLLQSMGVTGTGSGSSTVTAASIGLGNVIDWGVASNAETVAGSPNMYASAAGVAYAISQITPAMIGLGNVANIPPANLPISNLTAAALATKVSTSFTMTTTGLLSGGGNFNGTGLTLNVNASTNAQATGGTDTTTVMTPAATNAAIQALSPVITVNGISGAGNNGNVVLTAADLGLGNLNTTLSNLVTNTTTVTGGGLVTGGGALSANQVLSVTPSSTSLATNGTDTSTAMTPASTNSAIQALSPVKSVSGRTGAVVLTAADVGLSGILTTVAGLVPQTTTVTGSGIATGGGALSANQTIVVPPATQTQAVAGTDNTVAMTPLSTAQAIAALAPNQGRLIDVQVYPKNGAYTWTRPAAMTPNGFVVIEGVGAGGAGASLPVSNGTTTTNSVLVGLGIGAGGCAGAYGKIIMPYIETSATMAVTVGAGGVVDASPTFNGQSGAPSSVVSGSATLTFTGGSGGQIALYTAAQASQAQQGVLPATHGNNGVSLVGFSVSYAIAGFLSNATDSGKGLTVPLVSQVQSNGLTTVGQFIPMTGGAIIGMPNGEVSPFPGFLRSPAATMVPVVGTTASYDIAVLGQNAYGPGSGGNGTIAWNDAAVTTAQPGSDGFVVIYTYA